MLQHVPLPKGQASFILREIRKIFESEFDLKCQVSSSSRILAFKHAEQSAIGISAAYAEVTPGGDVQLRVQFVAADALATISMGDLATPFPALGDRFCPVAPPPGGQKEGALSLWLATTVDVACLKSLTRRAALIAKLKELHGIGRRFHNNFHDSAAAVKRRKHWDRFAEMLAVVDDDVLDGISLADETQMWAAQTLDFLDGNHNVALVCDTQVERDFALAVVGRIAEARGQTIAQLRATALPVRVLVELAREAPGRLAIPASALSFSASRYDIAKEVDGLAVAARNANPLILLGSDSEFQELFCAGQGRCPDPLSPVIRRLPHLDAGILVRVALRIAAAGQDRTLPQAEEDQLVGELARSLSAYDRGTQRRWLSGTANHAVLNWARPQGSQGASTDVYLAGVASQTESFSSAVSMRPTKRSSKVQRALFDLITSRSDPLLNRLRAEILGQDRALEEVVQRLEAEVLTRDTQPLRWCAVSTPGTGKSETCVLIARLLGVPYINIDASSMGDPYIAQTSLLGSGRGIVGSDKPGRLEEACKHHQGAVLEVSDVDHASPAVCHSITDTFLQAMETGHVQTSSGAMVYCGNLILAFTMNLPGEQAERMRTRFGFGNAPDREETVRNAQRAIQHMTSGAFLSRVGTPIVFDPISDNVLATIVNRAVRKGIDGAALHAGITIDRLVLDPAVGRNIVATMYSDVAKFGARALLEEARQKTAQAFLAWYREKNDPTKTCDLYVSACEAGNLTLTSV